jgi:hypothetical protein
MQTNQEILETAYRAFNARDLESALACMHPDVDWPNGMEGGRVQGHSGVRAYWTRQWKQIDSHVEPRSFTTAPDGRVIVDVHQVVRDLDGNLLADQMVQHVYDIQDELVLSMEIREA